MKKYSWLVFVAAIAIASCRKKPDPAAATPATGNGSMRITIQNVAGKYPLVLNVPWYQNENGDSFKVSIFKYYISNIVFTREDGTEFAEPESYHLVDAAEDVSKSFEIADLPQGNYVKLKFLIGVDGKRNTSGAQTGALDPIHGMFWDWNTGYIMAKMEGISPQSQVAGGHLAFHMGGFSGPNSVLKYVTLDFPAQAAVSSTSTPNIHLTADIMEWFKTPTTIKFKDFAGTSSPGADAKMVADNYADMFTLVHID